MNLFQQLDAPVEALAPKKVDGLPLHLNFFWTAMGNIAYALSQWAMIVALAKLTNAFMVGQFVLGLAISTPLIRLANLQLRAVQASDARREYHFPEYLGLRLVSVVIAFAAIGFFVFGTQHNSTTMWVIVAVAAGKSIEAISDIYYGLFQMNDRLDRVGQSMLLKAILSIAFLVAGLYFTRDVFWGVIALAFGWLMLLFLFDVRRSQPFLSPDYAPMRSTKWHDALHAQFHLDRQWPLIRKSFPLGVVMALIALNMNIPRYFVHTHFGEEQLGVFSALAYMTVATTTLADALGNSAIPRLSRMYAEGRIASFRHMLMRMLIYAGILGIAGVIVAAVAGGPVLRLAYGPEYVGYSNLFVWLMASGAVITVASVLLAALTATREFRLQIPMFIAACGVNALMCWWLIPILGLTGGAVAALIAELVLVAFGAGVVVYLTRTSLVSAPAGPAPPCLGEVELRP